MSALTTVAVDRKGTLGRGIAQLHADRLRQLALATPDVAPDPIGARVLPYALIIAAEGVTGILFLAGAIRLIQVRNAKGAVFNEAKSLVIAGATLAFLVWFFGFMVVAGEWFAMWQSQTWNGQEPAFRFYMTVLVVLIFVSLPDGDLDGGPKATPKRRRTDKKQAQPRVVAHIWTGRVPPPTGQPSHGTAAPLSETSVSPSAARLCSTALSFDRAVRAAVSGRAQRLGQIDPAQDRRGNDRADAGTRSCSPR